MRTTHLMRHTPTNVRVYDPATATPLEQAAAAKAPLPIGTIVYQHYRSTANKSTGKIVDSAVMLAEILDWRGATMTTSWVVYTVKCLDGQTRTFGDVDARAYFNRYQNLITDHEKKLATHRARMTRAEAL